MEHCIVWFKRFRRVLARIFRGENPLIIRQEKSAWEDQYRKGKWGRLRDTQENTEWIATKIANQAQRTHTEFSLLDVGCGEGALFESMLRRGSTVRYSGIDISEAAIEKAKTLYPKGTFLVMDVEHPVLDAQFDAIIFNEILYYVDARATLRLYRPLLKPGGVIVVSMYHSWRTSLLWVVVKRVLGVGTMHHLLKHRVAIFAHPPL